MMRRSPLPIVLSVLLGLGLAAAASAGTFTVTLSNGTSFETRYRPVEIDWDPSLVLIQTDLGNPIALSKDEIAEVTSSAEESGFGYQATSTTLFLGWLPNQPLPEEESGGEGGGTNVVFPELPGQNFTVEQFVNPPTVPGVVGGIPTDTDL